MITNSGQKKKSIWRWLRWVFLGLVGLLTPLVGFLWLVQGMQLRDVDVNNPPQFIQADFVDLDKFFTISKFRSGAGHSYPGNGETCRSMKHYYYPLAGKSVDLSKDNIENIYSPVDGRIMTISSTGEGDFQVNIKPDNAPAYRVRMEHVTPIPTVHQLTRIKAGDKIATMQTTRTVDISIWYNYIGGTRLFSYFAVMPDNIFANYQKRGITSRNDLIISKEYRDAHPLECLDNKGETPDFAKDYEHMPDSDKEHLVHLSGYEEALTKAQQNELNSINDFESCSKHYPVIQTSPEQCKTDNGKVFVKEQ